MVDRGGSQACVGTRAPGDSLRSDRADAAHRDHLCPQPLAARPPADGARNSARGRHCLVLARWIDLLDRRRTPRPPGPLVLRCWPPRPAPGAETLLTRCTDHHRIDSVVPGSSLASRAAGHASLGFRSPRRLPRTEEPTGMESGESCAYVACRPSDTELNPHGLPVGGGSPVSGFGRFARWLEASLGRKCGPKSPVYVIRWSTRREASAYPAPSPWRLPRRAGSSTA
jgi:hypothetical protein